MRIKEWSDSCENDMTFNVDSRGSLYVGRSDGSDSSYAVENVTCVMVEDVDSISYCIIRNPGLYVRAIIDNREELW